MEEFSPEQKEQARRFFSGPCDFVWGAADMQQLPEPDFAEVAFAGRSNVGKSSLINALTGRNTLARTSNTPGRTQQLNFFNLGGHLYLVDMPGYGYAKVAKKVRDNWDDLIFQYLQGRPNLKAVLIMIDSRHGFKETDIHLMGMLDKAAVNYRIVLTKIDKASKTDLEAMEKDILGVLGKHPAAYPFIYATSADKNMGLEDLRAALIALK